METDKVKYLEGMLKTNKTVSQKLLKEVNNNLEKAISLYKNSEIEEMLLIKGIFVEKTKKLNGLFYVLLNLKKLEVEKLDVFSTFNKDISETDITSDFSVFKRIFFYYKKDSDLDYAGESLTMMTMMKREFHPGKIVELTKELRYGKYEDVKGILIEIVNRAANEVLNLEIDIEEEIRINKIFQDDSNYLEANIEVDPIEGREVKTLKKDEYIYIYISDYTEYGRFIAKTIGAREYEKLIPIKRKIYSIRRVSKDTLGAEEYEIIIDVVDDVRARIIASGEIKIYVEKQKEENIFESAKNEMIETDLFSADKNIEKKLVAFVLLAFCLMLIMLIISFMMAS